MRSSTGFGVRPLNGLTMESKCALYACTENTGSVISDRLGNYADVTITGTTSDPLSTTAGWFDPNGSDTWVDIPFLEQPITDGGAWACGCNVFRAADAGANETLFAVGSSSIVDGILRVTLVAAGAIQVNNRGVGASSQTNSAFSGFDFTASNTDVDGVTIFVVFHSPVMAALTVTADLYINGAFKATQELDFSSNGGTGFARIANNQFVRFGSTVLGGAYLGDASSEARARAIFLYKQDTYDAEKMVRVAYQHHHLLGERLPILAT